MCKSVDGDEIITRYINEKSKYAPFANRIKYNAMMPNLNRETSVYRTTDLTDKEIWEIGERYVGQIQNKEILGRGDLVASFIYSKSLFVEPDTEVHRLHANIIGWPSEKSKIKLLAIELAASARLVLPTQ